MQEDLTTVQTTMDLFESDVAELRKFLTAKLVEPIELARTTGKKMQYNRLTKRLDVSVRRTVSLHGIKTGTEWFVVQSFRPAFLAKAYRYYRDTYVPNPCL